MVGGGKGAGSPERVEAKHGKGKESKRSFSVLLKMWFSVVIECDVKPGLESQWYHLLIMWSYKTYSILLAPFLHP